MAASSTSSRDLLAWKESLRRPPPLAATKPLVPVSPDHFRGTAPSCYSRHMVILGVVSATGTGMDTCETPPDDFLGQEGTAARLANIVYSSQHKERQNGIGAGITRLG